VGIIMGLLAADGASKVGLANIVGFFPAPKAGFEPI
jgi:hypothetical protein